MIEWSYVYYCPLITVLFLFILNQTSHNWSYRSLTEVSIRLHQALAYTCRGRSLSQSSICKSNVNLKESCTAYDFDVRQLAGGGGIMKRQEAVGVASWERGAELGDEAANKLVASELLGRVSGAHRELLRRRRREARRDVRESSQIVQRSAARRVSRVHQLAVVGRWVHQSYQCIHLAARARASPVGCSTWALRRRSTCVIERGPLVTSRAANNRQMKRRPATAI